MIRLRVFHQLHQHVAEAIDRIGGRTIRAVHRWQGMIGAENITGAINEIEMFERTFCHARKYKACLRERQPEVCG